MIPNDEVLYWFVAEDVIMNKLHFYNSVGSRANLYQYMKFIIMIFIRPLSWPSYIKNIHTIALKTIVTDFPIIT